MAKKTIKIKIRKPRDPVARGLRKYRPQTFEERRKKIMEEWWKECEEWCDEVFRGE